MVLLPSASFPDGFQAAIRDQMPQPIVNRFQLEDLIENRGRVVDVLFRLLDLDRSDDEEVEISNFVANDGLGRRLIWIDGRHASERSCEIWIEFMEQFAAIASEVPLYDRTVFATLLGGRSASHASSSIPLLTSHWWWGVVTPLDTEVFVSELVRSKPWKPAFVQTVSEVAGFDLCLATILVESWDGAPAKLGPILRDQPIYASAGMYGWSPKPSARPHPPSDSREAWSVGIVNSWGERDPHEHSCSACAATSSAIQRLIWLGQVRSLMPRIEFERQALAEWVHARRDRLTPRWKSKDIMSMEVGDLASVFQISKFRDDKRAPLARWLHRTRNSIAHLEILDAEELEQGRQLLRRETSSTIAVRGE